MSFFRKLFGCKGKGIKRQPPSTEMNDALQKLRSTEQLLREKRGVLEKNIKKEQATVKKNVNKNKQGGYQVKLTKNTWVIIFCSINLTVFIFFIVVSLNALNRKKCYEKQLSQNDSMLSTVIKQQSTLEIENTKNIVVDVLSSTSSAVKKANQNV